MNCSKCGGKIEGDGYSVVHHCERVQLEAISLCEPDGAVVECNPCPNCGEELESLWSGVKCNHCNYWLCL